jgi:nucleoside-diphosphate-sugar epimerase
MEKVLLTGANGFIGSHILHHFVSQGAKTDCLIRKDSDLSNICAIKAGYRYGDIRNLDSLTEAFKGYNFVIHNAAYTKDWGNYSLFHDTNVAGTINVLKACKENGIANVIVTGTISSYGEEDCSEIKNESCEYNSHYTYFFDRLFPCKMNYYRDTKAEATREAVTFARENSINLTVIEPVWVFGEREFDTGFYTYLKSIKDGLRFVPGSRRNRFHVIYAPDLARAYFLAYTNKLRGVHRIIVGNKKAEFMDKIFSLFCKEAGMKKPAKLPKEFLYPVAFALELVYTVFNVKSPPIFSRARINMFYDNIEYSTESAAKLLGFSPQHSLQEGIRKTVRWYKRNNYI